MSIVIRGYSVGTIYANPDELNYGSRAAEIIGEHWVWPQRFMLDQPPLFEYLLAVVMVSFGGALDTLRWVSVLAGSGTVVVVYFLGRSIFGRTAGAVAAVILMFDGFAIYYSRVIYIESTAILFISLAILFYWEGVVKRNNLRLTILGGVFFGLALDTKYISLVIPIALVLFVVLSRIKVQRVSLRGTGIYMLVGLLVFLPVLLDLYFSDRNPFFWLLDSRFLKSNAVSALAAIGQTGGGLVTSGFQGFVIYFTHVSSLDPFTVFPAYGLYVVIWELLIALTGAFFVVSFFVRRRMADAYLLLIFLGFMAFALLYPDKRYYFFLYPVIPLSVMFGGLFSGSLDVARKGLTGRGHLLKPIAACAIVALFVSGMALSASATPSTYKYGFGDWDEIGPIMTYVTLHAEPGAIVVTSLPMAYYYAGVDNASVQFASLLAPVKLYTLPVSEQAVDTPIKVGFPVAWVITPAIVEQLNPQFIIISKSQYDLTTTAFQALLAQNYYQPLSVKLVLFFVRDPGTTGNPTAAGS